MRARSCCQMPGRSWPREMRAAPRFAREAGWPYRIAARRQPVFSKHSTEDLRAVLAAYRVAKSVSWPQLHAGMDGRASQWRTAAEAELTAELEGYLKESDVP